MLYLPPMLDYGSPVNRRAPLNRLLIAWLLVLPKRYGGLRWLDLMNRYPGTLTGMGPSSGTSGWGGPLGRPGGYGSILLDGSNDSVDLSGLTGNDFFLNATFTVSLWYRTTGSSAGYIIAKGGNSGSGGWSLRTSTTGTTVTVQTKNSTGTDVTNLTSTGSASQGVWHHVTAIITTDSVTTANNKISIYWNGLFDSTLTASSNVYGSTADAVQIGRRPSGTFMIGNVDDVRIARGALSAEEIRDLYFASRLSYPRELNWVQDTLLPPRTFAPSPYHHPLRVWRRAA